MTTATTSTGKKVTVIGLGSMGGAIARAFISKGLSVTVWNRNTAKAVPFAALGATVADDLTAAIAASKLIVICVSDYKITQKILATADATILHGRTLVQLSTGTPKEARDFDAWAQQQGSDVLNGDIMAWPRQIGTGEATISIAGSTAVYRQHADMLQALAGTIDHVGEEPGASAVVFSAVMAYLAGNWIGFCHGALICEREGMRADAFGSLIASISPMLAAESKHMGDVIQHERYADPESTVKTTTTDLHLLVQHAHEAGISDALPAFAANLFQQAVDAGYGAEEHAAVIKVMRNSDR